MSKREITRNGKVYLFDGNKYAGSRSATANDIPTAADLINQKQADNAAAIELMNPSVDYDRTQKLMKDMQDKQEAEALLTEADRYGIDLDTADIPSGVIASEYVRENHRLLKTRQQMRTPEGQLELVSDQSLHENFLRPLATNENTSTPALLGVLNHPNATEEIYTLLAEHPNTEVRFAVHMSPNVSEKTRNIAGYAYTASNETYQTLGYSDGKHLGNENLAEAISNETEAVFGTRQTHAYRVSKGLPISPRETEKLRRQTNYAAGLLQQGIRRGLYTNDQAVMLQDFINQ